jgi:hypothetical protein
VTIQERTRSDGTGEPGPSGVAEPMEEKDTAS